MSIYEITAANIWIPNVVRSSKLFSESNQSQKYDLLKPYEQSLDIFKGILFYAHLFDKINTVVYYDEFNWVPLEHDEVFTLAEYANNLDTIIKGKLDIYPNQQQLKLMS